MKNPRLRRQAPDAGALTLAMLDPARGTIEAPVRAEIFGVARFQQHGRSLGEAHEAGVKAKRSPAFFPRLHDNIAVLREAHRFIGQQERSGHHVSPAGEWLLDNFLLVQAQTKAIHDGLPLNFYRDLPVLLEAHLAGLPRIYGVAWAFVAHNDSAFDETLLVAFLGAYQQTRELTLGEWWALPTTLRVVLIENLRRLAERVAATKAARELANLWCDRLEEASDVDMAPVFEAVRARGVERPFALQVMQRLHADSGVRSLQGAIHRENVRAALARALPDPAGAQAQQQAEEAADNMSVGNAISALRLLGDADWRGLIASTSHLMLLMQNSSVFRAERDDTQDTTLHAIEHLARRSGVSQLAIARTLLGLMRAPSGPRSAGDEPPSESPSHWLRGPGRAAMRQAIGLGPAWLPAWPGLRRRFALPVYLTCMVGGSLAFTVWFVMRYAGHSASPEVSWPWLAITALLVWWPVSEAVIALVHRLASESVPPRRLPRLALADGIPPEHRVLLVVPCMLTQSAGIQVLVRQLERQFLANHEAHAQFALLADFGDASTAKAHDDEALTAETLAALDALEASHAREPGAPRRFLLLLRERRWSDSEQAWIGWERKRGKLEQLLALLANPSAISPFLDLGWASKPMTGTPYVVTLDSDTLLPPGALRALVGVAAHPLNRPRVDASRCRVEGGYGILQPRIVTPLPRPQEATPFHWLFAGQCGIDPYSSASSEIYQDLFDEGSFSGKGLLQVQAVHAVLGGRLPEDLVLSHDLLEGAIARCGGVSDVTLIEDAPMHADVAASRVHRWTRGDWQLLPVWLQAGRYGLRTIDRWKMVDNLRRSVVPLASVVLLLWALFGGPLAPGPALALVLLSLGGGPLLGALAGLAPSRDDVALLHFFRQAGMEVGRAAAGALWNLALLPRHALAQADAVLRALWRMLVSRRGLLQWTTADAAQAAAATDLRGLLRRHGPISLLAVALQAVLLTAGTPAPRLAALLCVLWAGTPLWIWWASRPWPSRRDGALAPEDSQYLLGVAHDTWRYFDSHVGPASHHLPPDNVQTMPHTMVAQRTSPTNIGLYLLSLACARRFGWLDTDAWLTRSEQTLATMATLTRHRGHFLNWYDTGTLQVLEPAYVSTVDSGNLCIHLLTVAGACTEWLAECGPADTDTDAEQAARRRVKALAATCQRLAMEAEFGFLFDRRRRLFHIGLRVIDAQLDRSFYDLLASESRMASLWAIAKGDVPASHWAALGRPFFATGAGAGLRSWSGSMFEYLMPSLVLVEPPGSALASAAHAAVREQIKWADEQGVPWGQSESAYAVSDETLAYQYAPQGSPRLALRRTPAGDLVVAPYATALAALFEPQAAVANLRRLEGLEARGIYGFIEALDFTAERQSHGSRFLPVSTFMAHHQGMTLVALTNLLQADAPRHWAMGDRRIDAVSMLLQEPVPREVSRLLDPPPGPAPAGKRDTGANQTRGLVPGETALQPTQLLSNGRYSVALRANGAGWSRWQGANMSRERDDALRDAFGSFFYLRRSTSPKGGESQPVVSLSQHPAPDPAAHYAATFHSDRVCLDAQWPDLRTCCTVWVSPEDDIELRRVELWNTSSKAVTIELMSVFEVSLEPARADEAHPAFANLFVTADWQPEEQSLYLARRPRLAGEAEVHAVHFIAQADGHLGAVRVLTDRSAWLGRNRDAAHPLADFGAASAEAGPRATGLDPVACLSMPLTLPAHGMAHVTVATAAAASRAALETLVDEYRQAAIVERSSLMSATFARIRRSEQDIAPDDRAAFQTLATALALVLARPERTGALAGVRSDEPASGFDRRTLWRFGVSGDRPLIVVRIGAEQGLRLVRSLVQALRWWSWGGLVCDLVVVNTEPESYLMPTQVELQALRGRYLAETAATPASRSGGLQVLLRNEVSEPEWRALAAMARVHLNAAGRPLAHQVQELVDWHDVAMDERLEQATSALLAPAWFHAEPAPDGAFDTTSGHFDFCVDGANRTAKPWVNVLANPDFGCQVSEAGAGHSWAGNSRLHQLTAWSNDPVSDPAGERFLLQDLRSREIWNLAAGQGQADVAYTVSHGQGTTTIRHRHRDLVLRLVWCVDATRTLKHVRVRLNNMGSRTQRLRLVGLVDWMMGAQRSDRLTVRTAMEALVAPHPESARVDALLASQTDDHAGYGGHTAFLTLHRSGQTDASLADWTCDRRELFDARGWPSVPDHFGERAGAGLDPCAAVATVLTLAPGGTDEWVFTLGHGDTPNAARALARSAVDEDATERERGVGQQWDELLNTVTVQTPDPLFDVMVNRWLLYQTLACRLWARAGFYQAGGAYGFRDQLQDAMALATVAPQRLRQQLLLSASRQFPEGDVQHWWHAPTGAGVRTHFSDDLLWLPYATLHYLESSGDETVLDECQPFLEAPAIPEGAEDAYTVPGVSDEQASLYEHAARTIDRSLAVGVHGLPLMGSGDWNDGMNRVGHEGRGESVWLGWFLCTVVAGFAPLAERRGEPERAACWRAAALGWQVALRGPAWDGDWFLRAFFDDGSPLGGQARDECRIDLIAQAWSVLSGVATPDQQQAAMAAVQQHLVDAPNGLVRLLDPPLDDSTPSAGYIQAYPAGVRENGGQYSHAGVWALTALAELGQNDAAYRMFCGLSPAHRAADPVRGPAYEIEPYVMAGDVYTQPPYVGRGGWSWYTGSAAWMHRAALEVICGLRVKAGRICVQPHLPSHWPGITLQLQLHGKTISLIVCAAGASQQLDEARAAGTAELREGEWLELATLDDIDSRLVVAEGAGPQLRLQQEPSAISAGWSPPR